MGDLWLVEPSMFMEVPCDGRLWAPLRLVLTSDVSQARANCFHLSENRGEVLQSSWEMCTASSEHGCGKKAPAFCCFGERVGVPLSPQLLLCSSVVGGWAMVLHHPKCHRGSCPWRKLDVAPCPQPASPTEYHQLVCEVCDLPGTASRCGKNRATLPCDVSSARQGPSRQQHSGVGRRVWFQTMISLTGWSRTKITPCQSSAETSLKPSVHYGTEPLFLRLASLLVSNPAPRAFWGTNPAKSRLVHPELDLGEWSCRKLVTIGKVWGPL